METLAELLLTLVALSGELPTSQICRLPSTPGYQAKILKSLKKDGLLLSYYRNGLRGLRLTSAAKKRLLAEHYDWFLPYLSGVTETNRLKSDITRRLRLHRMAEVLVTMLNADVSVLPWEKPNVFAPTPPDDPLTVDQPTYYSSREVKELGELAVKIRGSRSTGVLLEDGGIFVVYNTGPGQMKWEYKAEMRLKALLEMELCQARLRMQFMNAKQSGIVFATDMGQMPPLMSVGGDKRHNYFVLDGGFEHFYYLTSDHHGEVILQLLCYPDERAVLDDVLSQGLAPPRAGWLMENDAMDGDEPVLFGYTCDMPRIKRFDNALHIHDMRGTLYCFDFQEAALRAICGPGIKIQDLDFEKVKALLFDGDC